MKKEDKPRLFPERFETGRYSGSPRDFTKGKESMPRGGVEMLEYWYSDDPEMCEYLVENFQQNVEQKIERLKSEGWDPSKQKFYATTQSHLDLGWRWRYRQGVAKAERTFRKLHKHFTLFDPFTFTGSQPAMYQWVKHNSPELWKKVVTDVKAGRHELQGGSWSEADGRMPSGEGWVRQRLYGQHFYARNFGTIATVSWFPDSFGYANNLPQIFSKSGATGFLTSKLVSNKRTKWPFWAWLWESPDGTRLLSYLSGNHNKLGPLGGYDVKQKDSDVRESYVKSFRLLKPETKLEASYETEKPENHENLSDEELPFIGCFFGEGDGGHGPQGIEMAVYRGYSDRGHVKWMSTRQIYDELEKYWERLPVWKDELYYQFHRGSLTTQTAMKRMNRFFEWNLPVLEGITALTNQLGHEDPSSFSNFYEGHRDQLKTAENPLEQMWQNTLLMQFHDVLPGTSVPEVYDECYEMWYQDLPLLNRLRKDVSKTLSKALFSDENLKKSKKMVLGSSEDQFSLLAVPFSLINASGASGTEVIEISKNTLRNMEAIAVLANNDLSAIQFVDQDKYCFDLDKKSARFIFAWECKPWQIQNAWLFAYLPLEEKHTKINREKMFKALCSALNLENLGIQPQVEELEQMLELKSKDIRLCIGKKSGLLENLVYKGENLLKKPAGLRSYVNQPYKEACWNMMKDWFQNPKEDFKEPAAVSISAQGPVKWAVKVKRPFGKASECIVEYSLILGKEGFGINVEMNFHEIETFVKYELPFEIDGKYTVAETPYATSKRRNNPKTEHDKARWEKWMHTFVCTEESSGKMGIAVINEGKYGYDTLQDTLGISIVQGPKYPAPDVVSWVREERKKRKKAGLGKPPEYADQGEHKTRLWVCPYEGSWREGNVHKNAHLFNAPPIFSMLNDDLRKNTKVLSIDSQVLKKFPSKSQCFLSAFPNCVEVPVLKIGETLPSSLKEKSESTSQNSLVFRVVNNSDKSVDSKVEINRKLLKGAQSIVEVDLLERISKEGFQAEVAGDLDGGNAFEMLLSLNPHDIRTFKILKNS